MSALDNLGLLVKEKRGERGIRAAASEIGISHATLSRVERGFMPDLENYRKICKWLNVDIEEATGVSARREADSVARVHFRKRPTVSPATAQSLATMILYAQDAFPAHAGLDQE